MLNQFKNIFSSPLSNQEDINYQKKASHTPNNSALAETSKTIEFQIKEGDKLYHQGELDRALIYYRQAVEIDGHSAQAHQKLAMALQKRGDLPEAMIHYRKAIVLNKAYENSEEEKNILSVDLQVKNFEQDLQKYTQITPSSSLNPSSQLIDQQHSPKNQENTTQSALLVTKGASLNLKREAAEVYLQQALAYSDEQRWQEAINACQQAVQIIPDLAEAYKLWGNALQRMGKTSEAMGLYAKALELQPDLAEVYANLGTLYAQKQKWQKAEEYYQKAIVIKPNFPGAYRNLAKVWKQLGKPEKALDCQNKLLNLGVQIFNAEEYVQLGDRLIQANQPEQAINHYLQAIQLSPDLRIGYQKIAETWEKLGKWQEAATYYRQMLKLESVGPGQQPQLTGNSPKYALPSQQFPRPKLPVSRKQQQLLQASPDIQSKQNNVIQNNPQKINKLELAIAKYEDKARQLADSAPLQANLGSLYAQKQDWQQALRFYQKAIQLDPTMAGAYRNLAKVLEKLGKEAEAAKCWYQALSIEPQSANAEKHYQLGDILCQQNQLEEAIICYRRAIKLKPDYAQAYFQIGKIQQRKKQNQEAIDSYRQAIKYSPQTIAYYHSLGAVLVQQQKWDEAISFYQKVIELQPDCWKTYHDLGDVLHKAKRIEEAILAYQMAIEAKPDNAEIQIKLGNIMIEQERWDHALDCYHQALDIDPKSCSVYLALGQIFIKQEQLGKAISAYRKAVELRPNLAVAYKNLGDALSKQGHLEQAIICFQKVIQYQPENFRSYFFLGTALFQQGHLERAIAYLHQAIDRNPNFAPAHHVLGEILLQQSQLPKQLDEAIIHLRRAVELKRNYFKSYYCLGYALAKQKKFDIALICYRKAIQLEPSFVGSYCHLGHALAEAGKPDEAAKTYLKALEIEPNLNFADNYLVKINFNMNSILYPLWDGTDLSGKQILVHTGQDFSEAIRLIPYLSSLSEMCSQVIVVVPSPLARLFSHIPGIESVVIEGMKLPNCDVCIPLTCVPYLLTSTETILQVPSLEIKADQFNLIPVKKSDIKVGIVWQSDRLSAENAYSLSLLLDSVSFAGVTLYNLQIKTSSKELKQRDNHIPLINCDNYIHDFADQAALINQLDLVITLDSTVAHLAGVLGKPVWHLLSIDTDPYWLLEKEIPSAYPTMRLFRQRQLGNWDTVFTQVKSCFQEQFLDSKVTTNGLIDKQTQIQIISIEELTRKTWQFGRLDGSVIAKVRLLPDGSIEGVNSPNESSWSFENEMVVFYHQEGFPSARFNSFVKDEGKWIIAGPFLLGGLHIHTLRECSENLDGEISFDELSSKTWEFGRLDGSVIAVVRLLPDGNLEGICSPNEASWSFEDKTVKFHHQDGYPTTSFTGFTKNNGKWFLSGLFLLGGLGMHILRER